MKKKFVFCLVSSSVIMLMFPGLAVTFVPGDAGMAVCFLLFFAVIPIYAVIIGAFAGKNAKSLWSLAMMPAVFFLLGTWIYFGMRETAFILYAGVYLFLGMTAMLISTLINKKGGDSI